MSPPIKLEERQPGYRGRVLDFFKRLDYLQLLTMAALLAYGVFFIYGTGYQHETGESQGFWIRQLIWIGVGMGVWLAMTLVNYRVIGYWSIPIYAIAIILLIAVLLVGDVRYGARRWLDLSVISFQPSELAKLAYICLISWLVALGVDVNKPFHWLMVGVLTVVPILLIVKEPDIGSAMVILFVCCVVLFIAGIRWRWIVLAFSLLFVAVPVTYMGLTEYHAAQHRAAAERGEVYRGDYYMKRIDVFINPESNPLGNGWNARQAELSVGSGGFSGKGYMNGTLHTLGYLPKSVANTDFIFSVIAEETGFIGSSIFVILYFLLVATALRTAAVAKDTFGRLLAASIAALFFMHSMVNVGMNIRLSPVTGIPLPLVSYGGSFMVITLFYLGILQSIYLRRRDALFTKEPEPSVNREDH